MVNPGGPSRACQECKSRRVRCDLIKPACGPCVKLGRSCSGAKAQGDIFIVDQTLKVKNNADKAKLTKWKSRSSESGDSDLASLLTMTPESVTKIFGARSPSIFALQRASSSPAASLPHGLAVSYEQPALAFWTDTWIKSPNATKYLNQHLDVFPELYRNSGPDSPVRTASEALSLAAFSSRVGIRELGDRAKSLYGKALNTTRAALANPDLQETNETLMAVLLLAEYEQTASVDYANVGSNLANYHRHIRGAIEIVRRRGSHDDADDANDQGIKLFRAVRLRVVLDSIMGTELIDGVTDKSFYSMEVEDPGNIMHPLYKTSILIPGLRKRVTDTLSSALYPDTAVLESLIAEAQMIDKQLVDWLNGLPLVFKYCSVACFGEDPEDPDNCPIWPGMVHVYQNVWIASFLNNYRILRIYIQQLIANCSSLLGREGVLEDDTRQGQVLYTLRQMVDEICGTIPYLMDDEIPGMPMMFGIGSRRTADSVTSWLGLRPLYVSSKVDCVPRAQKRWIAGRLMAIANEYGYKIATDLGKEASPEPEESQETLGDYQQMTLGT